MLPQNLPTSLLHILVVPGQLLILTLLQRAITLPFPFRDLLFTGLLLTLRGIVKRARYINPTNFKMVGLPKGLSVMRWRKQPELNVVAAWFLVAAAQWKIALHLTIRLHCHGPAICIGHDQAFALYLTILAPV
ncbi:hypothetical protein PS925_04491 [Pseudomonas fluorescens]|uniref:Uncharacterized protein n=1 Tax=Pseudomonas fluorescens TaxID=294 RepID=A0A5E7V516_PSEFL|nr:hypothetical protein PS925_04491 [Pseudomonas fluorescens]